MATITLAEASKLGLDDLQAGVAESIVTVDALYQVLPFDTIMGNALAYNREKTLGDVQVLDIGGEVTARAAAEYDQLTASLATIIGDAEVNGLIIAQGIGGNAGNDVVAAQIASKAKSVGRTYQNLFINGVKATDGFDGLAEMLAVGQTVDGNGDDLSFEMIDDMLALVKAKNGQVDFITMNAKAMNKTKALLRALGGAAIETVQIGTGADGRPVMVMMYEGIPIFRNDYIATNGTSGETSVFAGCFNDGSNNGIAGLTAANGAGIQVEQVGVAQTRDERIWRVKFYAGLVNYTDLALAGITGAQVQPAVGP